MDYINLGSLRRLGIAYRLRVTRSITVRTLSHFAQTCKLFMDGNSAPYCQSCICGKSFSRPETYTHHHRHCTKTKKRLADALVVAKEHWTARKRRRLIAAAVQDNVAPLNPISSIVTEAQTSKGSGVSYETVEEVRCHQVSIVFLFGHLYCEVIFHVVT